jgi:hypothetical protein
MNEQYLTIKDVLKEISDFNNNLSNNNLTPLTEKQIKTFNSLAMCYKQMFPNVWFFVYWCNKKQISGTNTKEITLLLRGRYEISDGVYPKIIIK